jgi:hypothetical protein
MNNVDNRDPSSIFQPCAPALTAPTFLVCTPQPLISIIPALNLPFLFWDNTSLVVSRSKLTYSFPIVPGIFNVSGCGGPGIDPNTGESVSVVGCPTIGGANITVVGVNFIKFTAQVGNYPCIDLSKWAFAEANNFTTFICQLPQGMGERLALSVRCPMLHFVEVYVCMCVCVYVRERELEKKKSKTERKTEKERLR